MKTLLPRIEDSPAGPEHTAEPGGEGGKPKSKHKLHKLQSRIPKSRMQE